MCVCDIQLPEHLQAYRMDYWQSRIRDTVGTCGKENCKTINNQSFLCPPSPFIPICDVCKIAITVAGKFTVGFID